RAADLFGDTLERGCEHLLALEGMLRCARKASPSRCCLSACGTAILARECALLIAHAAQTLSQRLEIIKRGVIDFRMVSAQNDLMLVIAENAALEFTGYGHGGPLVSGAGGNGVLYYNVHSRRINTVAGEPWCQDVPWLSSRNRPGGIHQ